ncbi:MAG: hypothetical protein LBS21_03245 [Clostridiales bacterium]|jgi:hypothetical protein|nr:hypothetical protein [Clostridiales bacterium]
MTVFIRLKSAGKRRAVLENVPYTISDTVLTLRRLITEIVHLETEKYNSRMGESKIMPFLTEDEISDKSQTGKVGFGSIYSDKKADAAKAVETALLCFADGLFRVILNETEITGLDTPVEVKENDVITFIRLTFLAGRLW